MMLQYMNENELETAPGTELHNLKWSNASSSFDIPTSVCIVWQPSLHLFLSSGNSFYPAFSYVTPFLSCSSLSWSI